MAFYARLANGSANSIVVGGFSVPANSHIQVTKEQYERILNMVDPSGVANITVTFLQAFGDAQIPAAVTRDTEYQADIANGFTVTSGAVVLNDDVELSLGTGQDAQLSFDGTDTLLLGTSGDITINASAGESSIVGGAGSVAVDNDQVVIRAGELDDAGTIEMFVIDAGAAAAGKVTIDAGGVELGHGVSTHAEITATGLKITNTDTTGRLVFSAAEPTVMAAGQVWVDIDANPPTLKVRNAANDAWLTATLA